MPDDSWNPKGLDIPLRRSFEIFVPNVCAVDMDTTGTWPFGRRLEDQVATRFLSLFLDMAAELNGKKYHIDMLGEQALWDSAPIVPKTPPKPLEERQKSSSLNSRTWRTPGRKRGSGGLRRRVSGDDKGCCQARIALEPESGRSGEARPPRLPPVPSRVAYMQAADFEAVKPRFRMPFARSERWKISASCRRLWICGFTGSLPRRRP